MFTGGLPFERGQTQFGGDTARIPTTVTGKLLGRQFHAEDELYSQATGLLLCVVKNVTGATAMESINSTTTAADRGNVLRWAFTVAAEVGAAVVKLAALPSAADGFKVCGVIDPMYVAEIVDDDNFFMVTRGVVDVMAAGDAGAEAIILGDLIVVDDDPDGGKVRESAAAADWATGGIGIAQTATAVVDGVFRIFHFLPHTY